MSRKSFVAIVAGEFFIRKMRNFVISLSGERGGKATKLNSDDCGEAAKNCFELSRAAISLTN